MTTATKKINGIDTEALEQFKETVASEPKEGIAKFQVTTAWQGGTKSETLVDGWELGGKRLAKGFSICIDEPNELLGENSAPNPQEVLMAAVNSCMLATYVANCSVEGIKLDHLEIETKGELDLRGFLVLAGGVKPGYDQIDYRVRIKGDGTEEQFRRVHEAVKATSPNYWNIAREVRLNPELVVE